MLRRFTNTVLILFLFVGVSCSRPPTIADLESSPPPELKEPKVSLHTFDNGLKLYFLENHELPTFEMGALIHVGTIHEPDGKLGLVTLMMEGLKTGGSRTRTGDEIDRELEQVAADLSAKAEKEYSRLKIRSLSKDIDLALDIFFDLLREPAFEPGKMEITRSRMFEEIRRRNEKPMSVANREFQQKLFGSDSVWARQYKEETVKVITRQDLQKFYAQAVGPDRIWLAVSGDFSFDDLTAKIEKRIAGWAGRGAGDLPKPSPVKKEWEASVNLISMPVNQSAIALGHFGDKRFNPDKYAVLAANQILGGSTFGSRLGDRIRTELGLAYSVYSDFSFSTDYGSFRMLTGTKTASTVEVIQESKKILKSLAEGADITTEELENAKNVILNQLIFQYEDPFEIVSQRMEFDYFGYPPDYLVLYQREIRKVTLDQVRDVLQRYYFPDKLIVMIIGDRAQMGDLSPLGAIQELPLDND
ncbi:MAG: insulinase family protein [Deltaproteobacteria bacterium]|nr:insulinase family protein [Deltaproteobacteria bacterium]